MLQCLLEDRVSYSPSKHRQNSFSTLEINDSFGFEYGPPKKSHFIDKVSTDKSPYNNDAEAEVYSSIHSPRTPQYQTAAEDITSSPTIGRNSSPPMSQNPPMYSSSPTLGRETSTIFPRDFHSQNDLMSKKRKTIDEDEDIWPGPKTLTKPKLSH